MHRPSRPSRRWVFPDLENTDGNGHPNTEKATRLIHSLPHLMGPDGIKRGDVIMGKDSDGSSTYTCLIWGGNRALKMFEAVTEHDVDDFIPLQFLTNELGSSQFFSQTIQGRMRYGWFHPKGYHVTLKPPKVSVEIHSSGFLKEGDRFVPVEFRSTKGGSVEWLLRVAVMPGDPIQIAYDWINKHVHPDRIFMHGFPTEKDVRLKGEPPLWRTLLMDITKWEEDNCDRLEHAYSFPAAEK